MVVLSKVVVVEFDETVDGLLDRAHLDQGHLVVLPVKDRTLHLSALWRTGCTLQPQLKRTTEERSQTY